MTLSSVKTVFSVAGAAFAAGALAIAAPQSEPNLQPSASSASPVRVLLGSAELTSGIPGQGPLTASEIKQWLADPANHAPLEVELPQGLAAGAAGVKIPADNPLTRAKIELGRQLYFDPRLSADGSVSCADCHHPDNGYAKDTQFGVGIFGQTGNRNSPASYNRILSGAQFWDGRAASLEEQAIGPIANPIEMGNTHDVCVQTVRKVEGYQLQFDQIFGDGVTIENIGKAIASFERVLVTGPSPYDFYEPLRVMQTRFAEDLEDLEALKEDDPDLYDDYMAVLEASQANPITESAKRGRELFFSDRAGCTACHAGANFADEQYHNLGVGMDTAEPDLGRFVVTRQDKDRGAFKTPTVRNVALTAPYMHDGSQKTLEEVVEWYVKGGHPNPWLSDKVKKLDLTEQEKQDLVEFMKALTGAFPKMETGRLPQS
jgi:cytochrome c peroxidase